MATGSNQRRKERALAEFRGRLEGMDAEQVRLMLDRRRVRTPERVAMAQERLAELERTEQARQARPGAAEAGPPPAPGVRRTGQDQADETEAAAGRLRGIVMPIPRQIARLIGIGLGVVGIAAMTRLFGRR